MTRTDTPIVLSTLNATYQHCAFGLRYLFANLRELRVQAIVKEFTISHKPIDIVEALLALNPRIVGFGVYIWNTRQTQEVVSILKRVRPDIVVALGGPEVSYEQEGQRLCEIADVAFKGEAEVLFYEFCRDYLAHGRLPGLKVLAGVLPDLQALESPYAFYEDEDIRHRIVYVEASRGCPYRCEFCLSSLDASVRSFPLEKFLAEMETLIERGVRQFKFVDRTFNLSVPTSRRILSFFLERVSKGLFLHFEMVPDRLPVELGEIIRRFPAGALQFEIGVQTWDEGVAKLVSRRLDKAKTKANFEFLRGETEAHLHADLIVGLPGETFESFARGFDALADLDPHEIQVGLLKRLKGTPIVRHDREWGMLYQDEPPFTVLKTKTMRFDEVQSLSRFAKFWDLYANSGNFPQTVQFLRARSKARSPASWFQEFYEFSTFLGKRHPQRYAIALVNLVESAWIYLSSIPGVDLSSAREALIQDYTGYVKRDIPAFLRAGVGTAPRLPVLTSARVVPSRQARHVATQSV